MYRDRGPKAEVFYDGGTTAGLCHEAKTGARLSPRTPFFEAIKYRHILEAHILRRRSELSCTDIFIAESLIEDLDFAIEAFENREN